MATLICATCRREVKYTTSDEIPYRPFCSERCKLLDLGRWLNEEYRISEEVPEGEQDESDGPARSGNAD